MQDPAPVTSCAEPLRRLNAVGSRKPKALATRLVSPGTKPEVVAADLWAVTSSPNAPDAGWGAQLPDENVSELLPNRRRYFSRSMRKR
ncbi:hypothetical protein CB1_001144018 [Camelus ferus]|nr:hypothetical protein CB1_001144018 [Camelus ferus]